MKRGYDIDVCIRQKQNTWKARAKQHERNFYTSSRENTLFSQSQTQFLGCNNERIYTDVSVAS